MTTQHVEEEPMTPQEALAALRQAWFEGVEPGPWHPAHRPGGPIVLDNANGDSIFVDADDAAVLVNILAQAGYTIVRAPRADNLLVEVAPELLAEWGTRTHDGKALSVAIGETRDGITDLTFTATDGRDDLLEIAGIAGADLSGIDLEAK